MPASDVTQMLLQWSQGDETVLDQLFPLVYDQLQVLARARLAHERPGHTLNTSALVHEAYLHLVDGNRVQWKDRAHFMATASRVMRNLLIDYAKRRRAQKRGGGQIRMVLDEDRLVPDVDVDKLLDLDELLNRLGMFYPRPAQALEMFYFGGLSHKEIATVLDISHATVDRDLRFGRTWLAHALSRDV